MTPTMTLAQLKEAIAAYVYDSDQAPAAICAGLRNLATDCDLYAMAITKQLEDEETD